jgi:hypothetical protein
MRDDNSMPLSEAFDHFNELGADGIWLIRGVKAAAVFVAFDGETSQRLELNPPHEMIVILRFPAGDGGEAGIESR